MEKNKFIIECELNSNEVDTEDNGNAKIFTADEIDSESCIFVRIQSWDDNKDHKEFKKFVNRKIKITIETID